ncbi:MAG TPA: DUF2189 domain-containing protein [Pseudolabrys sp.]|jgi:uncharacterized membrane protein|nr:DUF2189 domain-containing protein [Pseudolabrys sp.]
MAYSNLLVGAGAAPATITVRRIGVEDLKIALSRGFEDFLAMPSHAVFLCLFYPLAGLVLARIAFGYSVLPLIFPLASGFALVGPFAALGLYELSRRRESGLDVNATHAFDVMQSSSIGAIAALGVLFLAIFGVWLAVADAIYVGDFGYAPPESIGAFLRDVFTTSAGWNLIVVGNGIGLLFAAVVLTIGVVSFPLLLDHDVGAAVALKTSIEAVVRNPAIMALWGLIVAALLVLASLPAFLGLAVVLPVLGHATWHLYRRTVDADGTPRPQVTPRPQRDRSGADFPVNLLPWKR